jgi:hypothetical protein
MHEYHSAHERGLNEGSPSGLTLTTSSINGGARRQDRTKLNRNTRT